MYHFFNILLFAKKYLVRRYSLSILVFLVSLSALSGQINVRFENYNVEDGLPHSIASCIYQDKSGWIWVGTNRGLSKFDGYSFKTYLLGYRKPEEESSNINCIYEDSGARLWIGTHDAGLVMYNRMLDNFTYFNFNDTCRNCISSNRVFSLAADSSGIIWVGTDKGLNRFDPVTKEFQWIQANDDPDFLISGNTVQKVFIDSRHRLWIGTIDGLDYRNPETGKINHFNLNSNNEPCINESYNIVEINEDSKGNILLGTYNTGILIIDHATNEISTRLIPDPGYQRSYTVRTINEDKSGNLWLGTRGGIYILDGGKNIIAHLVHLDNDHSSLSHNSINNFLEDASGDYWIATRNGISHVNQFKQKFKA